MDGWTEWKDVCKWQLNKEEMFMEPPDRTMKGCLTIVSPGSATALYVRDLTASASCSRCALSP